jgi:hypothetical protein
VLRKTHTRYFSYSVLRRTDDYARTSSPISTVIPRDSDLRPSEKQGVQIIRLCPSREGMGALGKVSSY